MRFLLHNFNGYFIMIKKIKAYSLVEMMVVVVIMIILIAASTILFKTDKYYQDYQITQISNLIKTSRIKALQVNGSIIICSSSDKQNCNSSTIWNDNSVISFFSKNGTNTFDVQSDELLGVVDTWGYYVWASVTQLPYIKISGNGYGTKGELTFCQKKESYKEILVNSRGNISINDSTGNVICSI